MENKIKIREMKEQDIPEVLRLMVSFCLKEILILVFQKATY